VSYKDQEARRGPGLDLRGGQWRPEYNKTIGDMLRFQREFHKRIRSLLTLMSQFPDQGEDLGDGGTKEM